MKPLFVVAGLFSICFSLVVQKGHAQSDEPVYSYQKATTKTICNASFKEENTHLPPPASYLKSNKQAKTNSSNFEVSYVNFPPEAQAAFQIAVDIWASILESPVTIRINATWEPLGTGVLGAASPGGYVRNFEGVQKRNLWYPVALGEKMAGHDLNSPTTSDVEATFNSNYSSWYFGTDGATPAGSFDFLTIVLHEIGHGLGITHAYTVAGSNGTISAFFNNSPVVFESFIENNESSRLVTNFTSPSVELKEQLTGSNLFFNGPNVLAQNLNNKAKIYAPLNYSGGSSIAHVDEATYPAGNQNSLMTPQIGFAESIHDPGPIAINMLKDIGWSGTYIHHEKLKSTEDVNTSFSIIATINSEASYDENSVKLYHRLEGQEFTLQEMLATGTMNEFTTTLPATGVPSNYEYYIGVLDNFGAEVTNQGKVFNQGHPITQGFFKFETGPDTEPPIIQHQPKPFVLAGGTELIIEANISDNIELQKAEVEYSINDTPQGLQAMILTNVEDSLYSITLTYPGPLSLDDRVKYRIIATDNSVAQNVTNFPTSDFIELNAEGFSATQDFYDNDFNGGSAGDDFFGDALFSVITESGFENGAIHTSHPYPNGIGSELESEFVYQLKVPIRLKTGQATLKFDEIVLVEPGDGSSFGTSGFFDYVILEGSKDGGISWLPFADGYDSGSKPEWLEQFESSEDSETPPNSNAPGNPALFRTRVIDMLGSGKFAANEEIVIRFRLFADAFVHGWGWAIDNLKIQIDETPPKILHNQLDYILSNIDPLQIEFIASDINGLKSVAVDYQKNDEPISTINVLVTPFADLYTVDLDISNLLPGDDFKYTIRATDENDNQVVFPDAVNFVASFIDPNEAVNSYTNNFNSPSSDFAGNFFSVSTPLKFSSPALHSSINYPVGFGLANTSVLKCLLKKSIIVNENNPIISFDEIALLDPNDYMIVEASKDVGKTWIALTPQYNSESQAGWTGAWLNNKIADSTLFRNRRINLIEDGGLLANEKVLIQFSLFTNESITGWGWAMDNLSIQGAITSTEADRGNVKKINIHPNPAFDYIHIEVDNIKYEPVTITFFDPRGQICYRRLVENGENVTRDQISVSSWPAGLYIAKTLVGSTTTYTKVIVHH